MLTLKSFLLTEANKSGQPDDWGSIFQNLKQPQPPAAPEKRERPATLRAQMPAPAAEPEMEPAQPVREEPPVAARPTSNLPAQRTAQAPAASLNQRMDLEVMGGEPAWKLVKELPGFMLAPIRDLGRQVFAPLTSTPIENIQVMANVQGRGPTDQGVLDQVIGYLESHGQRGEDMEMEVQDLLPGYKAKVRAYTALGFTFLAVKDPAGKYIYAWPTNAQLAGGQQRQSLPGPR
jgi:hypothetical protein